MNAQRLVLMVGVLAASAGCSRHDEPPRVFGATETYAYLQRVGLIRALINTDNKDRIPAMIRSQDVALLGAQSEKTDEYRHTLSTLKPSGVDPDALTFTKNFEAILDSYKSVCLDSAELFREIKKANARPSGPTIVLPEIRFGTEAYQSDTIGTIDSLLESLDRMDAGAASGAVSLRAIVERVREDRDKLRSAKVAHHEFTSKMKAEFPQRYPDQDWTSKEILP
ncbi:MAG TPA: hypothetical protein VN775_09130 [Opitutaceae bacterium]|nr:hypothetical protein [Opitutaceae bacterium]